jgi:hypothetical protein
LQDENESLIGKHSMHAQEMQDEAIDLPNTVEVSKLFIFTDFLYFKHTSYNISRKPRAQKCI